MTDQFADGSVIIYPYLWRWQAEQGREHGEKDRPVCLVFTEIDAKGATHLFLLAISGTPPFEGQAALEIPTLELHRVGLSTLKRGWITVGEYNHDVLQRSYYLDHSQKPRGMFSLPFLTEIRQAAIKAIKKDKQARVDRLK